MNRNGWGWRSLAIQGAVALAYYEAAQFSFAFATLPEAGSTPVFIASGVGVGVLARWGRSLFWGIALSVFVLEWSWFKGWEAPANVLLILLVTLIVTLGKWGAASCLKDKRILDRPLGVVRFVTLGAFLSHLPVGFLCSLLVCAFGKAPWSAQPEIFISWWLSDAFGILITTPLLLTWRRKNWQGLWYRGRWRETLLLLIAVAIVTQIAFQSKTPLEYMIIPILVWSCFRLPALGSNGLLLGVAIGAVMGTARGYGSFAQDTLNANASLLLLQSFVGVIALTTLSLNAVLQENRQAKQALYRANLTLEDKVKDRTEQLAQANAEILALNRNLQQENRLMEARLDLVRQMQQMILPKAEELAAIADLDMACFMEAAEDVGGDYYDVLSTDEVVTISMGDVTGHGLESGVLMLMTQTAVRTLTEMKQQTPLSNLHFLSVLNRTLYKNIQRLDTDRNLSLVLINYSHGDVQISGQHEEILLVRSGGDLERIDTFDLGFPVGLEPEIDQWIDSAGYSLTPGDGLVLYTDGITEAINAEGQLYGLSRLCEVVSNHWAKPAEAIKNAVISDLHSYIGKGKVLDDITLLILKRIISPP